MTNRENLMCAILECGTLDLGVLDDVGYDWYDVLDRLEGQGVSITEIGFNGLMRTVVEMAVEDLEAAVEERVKELEEQDELEYDEQEALEQLRLLDPEDDVGGFFNFLDTHAYFEKNGEVYRNYLPEAIEEFEKNTGLSMENW